MSDARIRELESQLGDCENRIDEQQWVIEDCKTRSEQARDEIQIQRDLMYDINIEIDIEPFDKPV